MTNNEQKCFCGAAVDEYEGWVNGKISLMSCTNPSCWMHGDTQPEIFEKIQHQIQSRIDKEKAAAVIAERERVVREVLAVANSVSMPYKSYLVIKDVLNNIKDEIG